MPITRRQFEMGIDNRIEEWMEKIRAYLCEHRDEAFAKEELRKYFSTTLVESLDERYQRIMQHNKNMDAFNFLSDEWSAFESALSKLFEIRDIEEREIRDVIYYSCKEEAAL